MTLFIGLKKEVRLLLEISDPGGCPGMYARDVAALGFTPVERVNTSPCKAGPRTYLQTVLGYRHCNPAKLHCILKVLIPGERQRNL